MSVWGQGKKKIPLLSRYIHIFTHKQRPPWPDLSMILRSSLEVLWVVVIFCFLQWESLVKREVEILQEERLFISTLTQKWAGSQEEATLCIVWPWVLLYVAGKKKSILWKVWCVTFYIEYKKVLVLGFERTFSLHFDCVIRETLVSPLTYTPLRRGCSVQIESRGESDLLCCVCVSLLSDSWWIWWIWISLRVWMTPPLPRWIVILTHKKVISTASGRIIKPRQHHPE